MGDMGAYLSTFGPYIPHGGAGMLPGLYDIQAFHCRVRTVFTNTVPVDAYRGAGRPEAAYVVERLVDAAARKLGMTPDAIRRKNFIAPAGHALQDRDRQGLRLRRFHRPYEARDGNRRLERFPEARQSRKETGTGPRHRHSELCRGLRHDGRGDRQGAARTQWRRHGPDRHAVDRAGPPYRLRADRRRTIRAGARTRSHRSGRHRPGRDRPRHRRLGVDPDRRRLRRAGNGGARQPTEADRRGSAGNQRRRPRDRRRHRAGRRHRPRRSPLPTSPNAPASTPKGSPPARPSPARTAPIPMARISPRSKSTPLPASPGS